MQHNYTKADKDIFAQALAEQKKEENTVYWALDVLDKLNLFMDKHKATFIYELYYLQGDIEDGLPD